MEVRSLNNSIAAASLVNISSIRNPFMFDRTIINIGKKRQRHANVIPRKHKLVHCIAPRASSSGITKVSSEEVVSRDDAAKDGNLVFVAGATGRVGSRTVRELLKLGFKVRAGVRNMSRAESLVQIVRQMKLDDAANGGNQSIEKLAIVECDLEKPDQIGPALGNASIVICCIGASEKEIFDITGPYRIDYMASKNIIDAATIAKVDHFILLTSLGTNKFGFPAAILNLFWGVLCWKRKAEEALEASGLPYTIVRPGGMERPTDAYKLTHNITLSEEDTLFGGQVSNLQVAELMAVMAKNRRISYCKVVEVIAETTAPLTPMEDLLAKIPSKRIEINPPQESGDVDESSPSVSEIETSEPSTPPVVKEDYPAKPVLTRPLSPYTAYEDLKPPTTPSPSPSNKTGDLKANLETLLPVSDLAVESSSLEASSPVSESGSIQKEGKRSLSPYPNYPDLRPPVSPTPNPPELRKDTSAPEAALTATTDERESNKIVEIVGDPSEIKSVAEQQLISRPLSPYTAYPDLKPPVSPTPNPPGLRKDTSAPEAAPIASADDRESNKIVEIVGDSSETESLAEKQLISRPLSPYTAYADLKPPSSPSPTPSGPKGESSVTSKVSDTQITGDNNQADTGTSLVENDPTSSAPSNFPDQADEDLKPPSSPTPNAPVIAENGGIVPEENPNVTQDEPVFNQYTLSPFTMYEDLKPPSSPSPSFREP